MRDLPGNGIWTLQSREGIETEPWEVPGPGRKRGRETLVRIKPVKKHLQHLNEELTQEWGVWDSLHDWCFVMGRHKLFKKARKERRAGDLPSTWRSSWNTKSCSTGQTTGCLRACGAGLKKRTVWTTSQSKFATNHLIGVRNLTKTISAAPESF